MGISNLTEKRLKNVKQSDHLLQCNCTINFDDFDILAADSNKFKLLLRERLLIKRDKQILNRTIISFPLQLFEKMTVLFLLLHDCQDVFNTLGCFDLSSQRERKKYSFENALVEKSESSTRNTNGLVEGL